MTRKTILFLLISIWGFSHLSAQSGRKEFDKLIFLYIDEKYEKCAKLGKNYTENSDLRREPIPYLYVSMSLFEISKSDVLREKYPTAFKNSMKYAYKYRSNINIDRKIKAVLTLKNIKDF